MPTAAFSWTDHAATAATLEAVAHTGSYDSLAVDSAYPLINAQHRDPSRVTRVNFDEDGFAGDFRIQFNWGDNRTARVLAAINVRLPTTGVTSLLLSASNAAGSTIEAIAATPYASLVPIPGTVDRFNLYRIFAADQQINRVRLVVGTAAASVGYVEVGRLWAGPALVFPDGSDAGWSLDLVDPSDVEYTRGGLPLSSDHPGRQRLSVDFGVQTYQQMLGDPSNVAALNWRAMVREARRGSMMVAVHRSDDVHASQVSSIYGAIQEMPSIEHQSGPYHRSRLVVAEAR